MNIQDKISPFEKLVNFGACVIMPDSKAISTTNRFVVKPINWLRGQENIKSPTRFICKHILSRIVGLATSAFAALDFTFNALTSLGKLPLAALRKAGIKKIPKSCSFRGIRDNLLNAKQSLPLIFTGSFIGATAPEKLANLAYPISEKKKTPVFGYHQISPVIKDGWTQSPELFEKHLEHLYQNNYELCTFKEFLDGYQPSDGKKLAVITFDDSHENQFCAKGVDKDGKLEIDENCAIGVFEKFKAKHPDFRCVATFFANTSEDKVGGTVDHQIFANDPSQKAYTAQKLRYLLDNEYELGSHGHRHRHFGSLSPEEIQEDIRLFDEAIEEVKRKAQSNGIDLSNLKIETFAWPFGDIPSKEKRKYIDERFKYVADFGWNGRKVDRKEFEGNEKAQKRVRRVYIGPDTGFTQYAQ